MSFILEFGGFAQIIDRFARELIQERFPVVSFNNKHFSFMDNRHDPKETEPPPASLTIYRRLIKGCLYIIRFSCLLLVTELILKPIQIRLGAKKGRVQKVKRLLKRHTRRVSHTVGGFSTN